MLKMTMVLEVLKLLNIQELLKRKVHFSIMASSGGQREATAACDREREGLVQSLPFSRWKEQTGPMMMMRGFDDDDGGQDDYHGDDHGRGWCNRCFHNRKSLTLLPGKTFLL